MYVNRTTCFEEVGTLPICRECYRASLGEVIAGPMRYFTIEGEGFGERGGREWVYGVFGDLVNVAL